MKPKINKDNGLTPNEIDLLARFEYEGLEVHTRKDIISKLYSILPAIISSPQ